MVRADGSRPKVVNLNLAVYWMDVSDANSCYIFNEKGNKGIRMGQTKKIFNNKKKENPNTTIKVCVMVFN